MENFKTAVDRASADLLHEETRDHLGASVVAARCARQAWYEFRWVYRVAHGGRILRLFQRGREEETRIIKWLRALGVVVYDRAQRLVYYEGPEDVDKYQCVEWDLPKPLYYEDVSAVDEHLRLADAEKKGPKQWGFKDGHYAGSGDGVIEADSIAAWFPHTAGLGRGLFESKTHNTKSFTNLVTKGVLSAKPEHYNQVQQYMHKLGLKWCLYVAVNKNDDDLYYEVIMYKQELGRFYEERAHKIISMREAPKRLTEDPSWFECKYCDFREICHRGETPQKNCRSCAYAEAVDGPEWRCNLYSMNIPQEFIKSGCDKWDPVK